MSDLQTWCPHCGPRVEVDEDGCCDVCGTDAMGRGADAALDALAGSEGRIARAEEERVAARALLVQRGVPALATDSLRDLVLRCVEERDKARANCAVDGPVYRAGRMEGHADVCAQLRAILDPEDAGHLNIDGLLAAVERLVRWRKLLGDAPGEAAEVIRERALSTEAMAPIIAHWREAVAQAEAERDAARAKVAALDLLPLCSDTEPGRCDLVRRYLDERDAARAEVERLRETVRAVVDACPFLPVSAMRVMPLRLLLKLDELRVALAEHEEEVDRGTP